MYGKPTVCLLVLFAVFDFLVARHTKARYFTIHVLANTIIVILTFPSLVWILQDPLVALASDDFSPVATASCLCIHLYHILAFNNLIWLDWLHHGIMIGEGCDCFWCHRWCCYYHCCLHYIGVLLLLELLSISTLLLPIVQNEHCGKIVSSIRFSKI